MLNELAKEIHDNATAHGWWDEPRNLLEIAALCHSELSEAVGDLAQDAHCMLCKHHRSEGGDCIGMSMCAAQGRRVGWQWRGTEGKA